MNSRNEHHYNLDNPHNFDEVLYKECLSNCDSYKYENLTIHAGKGIHERAFEFLETILSKDARILVLGAGTGAFDRRLENNGYSNITSADINFNNYQNSSDLVAFVTADLNQNFSANFTGEFDAIIAIEIIEHLYSTHHFLNETHKLLATQGCLLITTPNPRSYLSRIKFLTSGFHNRFYGVPMQFEHINPIHMGIFLHHCHFCNFQIDHFETLDDIADISGLKKVAVHMISAVMVAFDLIIRNGLRREHGKITLMKLSPVKISK